MSEDLSERKSRFDLVNEEFQLEYCRSNNSQHTDDKSWNEKDELLTKREQETAKK